MTTQYSSVTCPASTDDPLSATIQKTVVAVGFARTSQRTHTFRSPTSASVSRQTICGESAITHRYTITERPSADADGAARRLKPRHAQPITALYTELDAECVINR